MALNVHNISKLSLRELSSARTGERYSHSSALTDLLGFKNVFVHHEVLPAGRRSSAPHSHSIQEEMILVLEGNPVAHRGEEAVQLAPGDFFGFPAGDTELHFVENTSAQDARLLVISSKAANDSVSYASRTTPHLRTNRLILRLATERDVPAILRYFSENKARFAPTDPPKPEGFHTESFWVEQVRKAGEEFILEHALRLFLFEGANDSVVVGTANFTQMSRGPFQACYLGYSIDGRHEGQGLMTEALTAAIRYIFSDRNFHRIMANHLPENERSARLLKRLGFVVEGKASNYLMINGQWRDHVLTALTNPAWRAP